MGQLTVQQPRLICGKYDAAMQSDETRKHWSLADSLSADQANSPEVRERIRNRARYEVGSNSYAQGLVQSLANWVIGGNIRLQCTTESDKFNKAVEWEWDEWQAEINLTEKVRLLKKAKTVDGEAFAEIVKNPAILNPVKIDIHAIEADNITGDWLEVEKDNEVDGIRFDQYGNPESYSVAVTKTNSLIPDFRRVKADFMIHWFRTDRPEQHRGISELTPSLPLFAQLRRYTLAVLAAAETAADMAMVVYTDSPMATVKTMSDEEWSAIELERRTATIMPEGWKIGQSKAEQPVTTYGEFKREILGEIARCLQVPVNITLGDSSNYNYASGRLDHQTFIKSTHIEQRHCERRVLLRIFRHWYNAAIAGGLVKPPAKYRDSEISRYISFFWDGIEHVDPLKEANATSVRLANRQTTLAIECAKQGQDWEEVLLQSAREQELMNRLGLSVDPSQTGSKTKTSREEYEDNR